MNLFQGKVVALSQKGFGVVKTDSQKTYFVANVFPGDEILFSEIIESKKLKDMPENYRLGKLEKILRSEISRRSPPCEYFVRCHGCAWMEIPYEEQLRLKKERLIYALKRKQILFSEDHIADVIPSPSEFYYRNRAQVKTDGAKLGFVDNQTLEIVAVEKCMVLNPRAQEYLTFLQQQLPNSAWVPGIGHRWNFIDFDDEQSELNDNDQPIILNKRRPFKQGNSAQNEFMKNWLRSHLSKLRHLENVTELFCGAGNFTEVIAEIGFSEIKAIEVQGVALEKLTNKKLANVEVIAADLFKSNIWLKLQENICQTKILILDPPREGMKFQRAWFKVMPDLEWVFYISCELDSFVKDIKEIQRFGFQVEEILPLDQFPQTPHLEILCVLKKN